MIKSLLISLRQKPRHVRNQIALLVAGGFTLIVALVWLTQIPAQFRDTAPQEQGVDTFSVFMDSLSTQVKLMKEMSDVLPDTEALNVEPVATEPMVTTYEVSATTTETAQPTAREVRIVTTSETTSSSSTIAE